MLFDDYQRDAARTINPQGHPHDLINHTLGLAGESGEVVEMVKKHLYHGRELDQQRLAEELGDVLWYVAAICSSAGLSLGDVAQDNITKLRERYPQGFTSRHVSGE
jgi:NTP pyrophosphatase (non-canonical NTP hydrolase)